MKLPTFLLIGLLGLSLAACQETKTVDQEEDPGHRELGAMVEEIFKTENIEEAIWNPQGMNVQDFPTIEVHSEEELRELLRSLSVDAQQMKQTFDQVNQVNQKRYESYVQELSSVHTRRDSLQVAMKFPDIVYLRDTAELRSYGFLSSRK